MSDDAERVWHADCRDCGWQRTVDSKDRAEELRCKHEGIAHDDDPTWHTVERRWERVATDGGVESTGPAETADRGCEWCGDTSLADLKAARNDDGSIDHVCPECYRDGRGRAATTRIEGQR